MNTIQTWLYLIGTPERARKLRLRVDGLKPPPLDEGFGEEPSQCPTTVLHGAGISRVLYANPDTRPALDAWDTGQVSKSDIRRWCLTIEQGKYNGKVFNP
jgi:hypothetical protein